MKYFCSQMSFLDLQPDLILLFSLDLISLVIYSFFLVSTTATEKC